MLFSGSHPSGKMNSGVSCKARLMHAPGTKQVSEQEKDFRIKQYVCGETDASCDPHLIGLLAPLRDLLNVCLTAWRRDADQQCPDA